MTFKSRIRERRQTLTIDVKVKTLSSGQNTEATVSGLGSLTATREQRDAFELTTDAGATVIISDVFWFEQLSNGTLPAIEEKHVLVDGSSVRYEVLNGADMGGEGNRLRVMTRRLRYTP